MFSLCLRGNVLYSGGADNVIRSWHLDELRKGTKLVIKGHREAVSCKGRWLCRLGLCELGLNCIR